MEKGIVSVVSGAEMYEAEVTRTSASSARVVTPIFGVTIELSLLPPGNKVQLQVVDPGHDPELAAGASCVVPVYAVADAVQRPQGHPYGGLGHACFTDAAAVAAVVQTMAAAAG